MFAVVLAITGKVVMVNVALLVPAGTGTVAGTDAALGLLLVTPTDAPALGAGPDKVTVPVTDVPPMTEPDDNVIASVTGGPT